MPADSDLPPSPALPTLWLIGDSTVRVDTTGQCGWGDQLAPYLDASHVNLVNRAIGARSSRTFLTEGRWDDILARLKPRDIVVMQFGHNDASPVNEPPPVTPATRCRGTLPGVGDQSVEVDNILTGLHETVRTYGWYLRHYVGTTRAAGAIAVICSPVPFKRWTPEGRVARASDDYGRWAAEVAAHEGALFVDLNEIIARAYETMGPDAVEPFFADACTHTNDAGAFLNARCFVSGVNGLGRANPLAAGLSASGKAVPAFTF